MKILYWLMLSWMAISCGTTHYCYVVRHAEKLDKTPNSVLSSAGHARAGILKNNLQNRKIELIFATSFQRTQETAQPLATFLNKSLLIYRNNAEDSIATVISANKNRNILLVGHSGNIPRIIEMITGKKITPIREDEYDNLYIIGFKKRKVRLTVTKY
jgi:broad specificity phosphatase PhoE